MNLHHRPLFLFTIIYICGIILAVQFNFPTIAGIGIGVGIFLTGWFLLPKDNSRLMFALLAAVFIIGFARTAMLLNIQPGDVSHFAEGKQVYLVGTVASDPEILEDRTRLILQTKTVKTYTGKYSSNGKVMVTLYRHWYKNGKFHIPSYGEVIQVHGRLKKPRLPTNPGAFDYQKYLARRGIHCTLSAGVDEATVLQPSSFSVRGVATRIKSEIALKARNLFTYTRAKLLLGILFGDYTSLPSDVQNTFMRTGTMHLLAASGFNCGIIVLGVGFLLRRLSTPRTITNLALIASLWGFVLLANSGPSIFRAAMMSTLLLAAFILWRVPDVHNIIMFTSIVILGLNPLSLFDTGFQLSFAAVMSIILIMPLIQPWLDNQLASLKLNEVKHAGLVYRGFTKIVKTISDAVILSILAAIGTMPITAFYFNYVSVISVVANAATALLVMIFSYIGAIALLIGFINTFFGKLVALLAYVPATIMLMIVEKLGSYPWSITSVRSPSPLLIALYYILILGILEYAYRKAKKV